MKQKKIKLIELLQEDLNKLMALAMNVPQDIKLGLRVEPNQLNGIRNGKTIYIGYNNKPWLKVRVCKIKDNDTIEFYVKGFIVNEPRPNAKVILNESQ